MAPKSKEKPKTTAAGASPAVAIEDLFTSLNNHIQRSEFDQAIRVADQVLLVEPDDEDAIQCKVVALIRKDSIDKALSTIQESSRNIDFGFLKAYCLYRQNKFDEALECLKPLEESYSTLLLESHIQNRLGKVDACVDIYQKLLKSKIDLLEINVVASLVSAGRSHEVPGAMDILRVKATNSFELAFNTACSLIERGKFADAEELLSSAHGIGQATLKEENLPDDVIEIELAPIAVQLAYVQQILGRTQNSLESYTNVIKRNLADEPTLSVAINNLISIKGPKDISDSLKKLDRLFQKGDGDQKSQLSQVLALKLTPKQKEAVYLNRVLLLLHSNKMDQARELVNVLPGMFPNSVMPVLVQAALHVKENKAVKAEEILGQYADKFPEKSKVVLLARAQIAASAGHYLVSADSLSKIADIQHMPASIATIVSLKERAGDIDGAESVFDSAIQWWSNSMAEEGGEGDNFQTIIIQEAAAFKLKHGKKVDATRLYEQLVKSRNNSIDALVGLIQTAAEIDIDKAEAYEKKLKQLPGLKLVDIAALERTSGAKPVENSAIIPEPYEPKSKEKMKKKRKRKPKYPKGFDPTNPGPPPDPERWLPKRERSSYRPKRKDKRAAQVRGSQGAVGKDKDKDVVVPNTGSKSNETPNSKGNASHNVNSGQSNKVGSNAGQSNKAGSNPGQSNKAGSNAGQSNKAGSSKSSKKKSRR